MFRCGKTAQNAIMAMSCLAEAYDEGATKLSSQDIAQRRRLPKPNVAKLLVALSQANLLLGTPGPRGGYWLAKPPSDINLYEIVALFEQMEKTVDCPLGAGRCGQQTPCALHDELEKLDQQFKGFLRKTTLEVFSQNSSS